ncbi:MAG: dihydrofolate reductase [Clostridium sp.]|nr:dihydrofolate reductase [Clostridium sp.]
MTPPAPLPVVTIVVAVTRNGAIGRGGDMLFHIPDDLRHFRRITMGHPVVMGRKTFESLPGGALPGRRNIVITRDPSRRFEGAETADSLFEALTLCADEPEIMIIGGGEIYREAIAVADRIELTLIDAEVDDADTFFPEVSRELWDLVSDSGRVVDSRSGLGLNYWTFERKQS